MIFSILFKILSVQRKEYQIRLAKKAFEIWTNISSKSKLFQKKENSHHDCKVMMNEKLIYVSKGADKMFFHKKWCKKKKKKILF